MAKIKKPCPVCGYIVKCRIAGLFTKKLKLPKTCGNCGQMFYRQCPNCEYKFIQLSNYCPNCKHIVYKPSNPIIPDHDKEYLKQLRSDIDDFKLFYKEYIHVILYNHPVNIQIANFNEKLNDIDDDTANKVIADIVERAFSELNLSAAIETFSDYDKDIADMVQGLFLSCTSDLVQYFDSNEDYLPDDSQLEELAQYASTHIMQALLSPRGQLQIIQKYYYQLTEYLPRYKKILRWSKFWVIVKGVVIGIAAGLLGIDLETTVIIGEEIDNWNHLSDAEFMEAFGEAFQQFCVSLIQFEQDTWKAVEPVIQQILTDYAQTMGTIIDSVEMFAAAGLDIQPIYAQLRKSDQIIDEDTIGLYEAVLSNLREEGLSGQSERNLQYLLSLEKK